MKPAKLLALSVSLALLATAPGLGSHRAWALEVGAQVPEAAFRTPALPAAGFRGALSGVPELDFSASSLLPASDLGAAAPIGDSAFALPLHQNGGAAMPEGAVVPAVGISQPAVADNGGAVADAARDVAATEGPLGGNPAGAALGKISAKTSQALGHDDFETADGALRTTYDRAEPSEAADESVTASAQPATRYGDSSFSDFSPTERPRKDRDGNITVSGATKSSRFDFRYANTRDTATRGNIYVTRNPKGSAPSKERLMTTAELRGLQAALGLFLQRATVPPYDHGLYQEFLKGIEAALAKQTSGLHWTEDQIAAFVEEHGKAIRMVRGVKEVKVGYGVAGRSLPLLIIVVDKLTAIGRIKKEVQANVPDILGLSGVMGVASQVQYQDSSTVSLVPNSPSDGAIVKPATRAASKGRPSGKVDPSGGGYDFNGFIPKKIEKLRDSTIRMNGPADNSFYYIRYDAHPTSPTKGKILAAASSDENSPPSKTRPMTKAELLSLQTALQIFLNDYAAKIDAGTWELYKEFMERIETALYGKSTARLWTEEQIAAFVQDHGKTIRMVRGVLEVKVGRGRSPLPLLIIVVDKSSAIGRIKAAVEAQVPDILRLYGAAGGRNPVQYEDLFTNSRAATAK